MMKTYSVRLPQELADRLAESALQNRRSLAKETIVAIEEYLRQREQKASNGPQS